MSPPSLQLRDRAPDRDVVGVEHDAEGEVVDGDEDDRVETLLAELRDRRVVQRTGNRAGTADQRLRDIERQQFVFVQVGRTGTRAQRPDLVRTQAGAHRQRIVGIQLVSDVELPTDRQDHNLTRPLTYT